MTRSNESIRAFETWMRKEYPSVELDTIAADRAERADEHYDGFEAQLAWDVWLAAQEHATKTMCNRN